MTHTATSLDSQSNNRDSSVHNSTAGIGVFNVSIGVSGEESSRQLEDYGGTWTIEENKTTKTSSSKVTFLKLVLSTGGLFTIGLSGISIFFFIQFAIGLYRATFIDPSLALFASLLAGGLTFEVLYSRKFIKKI